MINGLIALASFGIAGGGTFGNFLYQLQNLGVFSYVLPFLMIFSIVFAVLTKSQLLGDNKGVHLILAVAVGLLALQFNFVSYFFAQIFPRLGVLLSILLTFVIVLSMIPSEKEGIKVIKYVLGGIGGLGAIIIVIQSFSNSFFGWSAWGIFNGAFSFWLQQYGSLLITGILLVGGMILVFVFSGKKGDSGKPTPTH